MDFRTPRGPKIGSETDFERLGVRIGFFGGDIGGQVFLQTTYEEAIDSSKLLPDYSHTTFYTQYYSQTTSQTTMMW